MKLNKNGRLEHWQWISLLLILYDAIVVNASFGLALWIRFDCQYSLIPPVVLDAFVRFAPIYTIGSLFIFIACKLYQSIWRFASVVELNRIVVATMLCFLLQVFGIHFYTRMPLSYYILGIVLQFLFVIGIRFSYRFVLLLRSKNAKSSKKHIKRVLLVGAGSAGKMILTDTLKRTPKAEQIVAIIDDNSNKWNRYIDGVPVVGGRDDILMAVEKFDVDSIYVAIPSASKEDIRDILNICSESGCELKNLPGILQIVDGDVTLGNMKDVSVEDLLGRDPIQVDLNEVFTFIRGKKILVTGAGGSIGSELSRQIAAHNPKQLILFDVYENNVYDIQLELREKYPNLDLVTLIGSVRDSRRIYSVFQKYRPDVVYHAAAHKHVPLMEDSPCESIKNNVIGTYKTAYAAMMNGCQRFVLISTDKAVNPTNIMGASKRLCEMVIQSFDAMIKKKEVMKLPLLFEHVPERDLHLDYPKDPIQTEFVAVRFGNVLGSNGSVIPIFKKQIAAGGPVTVTHPDIIRYFMTIPEAVSLVLQAGTYAQGGEIFVLDMGSPVKIDTLARNLIKLSGYKPDVDIMVEYTGLRPGEKLYEEKLMAEEGMKKTPNDLIHIGCPIAFDTEEFLEQLEDLMKRAYVNDENIREYVQKIVPTYQNAKMKDSTYKELSKDAK